MHKIKTAYSGGSSKVFNKALNAAVESMCTSSIMKILYLLCGANFIFSTIFSRTLSTCV